MMSDMLAGIDVVKTFHCAPSLLGLSTLSWPGQLLWAKVCGGKLSVESADFYSEKTSIVGVIVTTIE